MKNVRSLVLSLSLLLFFSTKACADFPGASLFQLDSAWTTQDGKPLLLKELSGRPTILALVYLSCQYLCPTIISEVQGLEAKLSLEVKEKTQVVLISFDPEKDTAKVMKDYATKRKVDGPRWTFLTGKNDSQIRELANALNFKYQKIEGGDFTHSFMVLVLDDQGVPTARVDLANQDKKSLVDAITRIANRKK